MKKIALIALLALGVSSSYAKEMKFLPIINDSNYCFSPSVALLLGNAKYKDATNSSTLYGVELSIACPALQLETQNIKQQISLVHYSKKNGFSSNTLEFNPHVMFDVADKFQVGVGPGFGLVFANTNNSSSTVLGLNLGASANYEISNLMFIGAEARYQWTTDANFGGSNVSLNNFRTLLKVGYHF